MYICSLRCIVLQSHGWFSVLSTIASILKYSSKFLLIVLTWLDTAGLLPVTLYLLLYLYSGINTQVSSLCHGTGPKCFICNHRQAKRHVCGKAWVKLKQASVKPCRCTANVNDF